MITLSESYYIGVSTFSSIESVAGLLIYAFPPFPTFPFLSMPDPNMRSYIVIIIYNDRANALTIYSFLVLF